MLITQAVPLFTSLANGTAVPPCVWLPSFPFIPIILGARDKMRET